MRDTNVTLSVGISAGSVWFTLQDLARNVEHLPDGELRDAWVEAVGAMQDAVDGAMTVHRRVTGRTHPDPDGPGGSHR